MVNTCYFVWEKLFQKLTDADSGEEIQNDQKPADVICERSSYVVGNTLILLRYNDLDGEYPDDAPSQETLISFSLVTLLLHGVSAFAIWRQYGGYR